jgi:hypothetical protein
MSVVVLGPERMWTPTVAVICVVALAVWGHIRLKITPRASRAAAARALITFLRMIALRPKPPGSLESHKSHKTQTAQNFNLVTTVTARPEFTLRAWCKSTRGTDDQNFIDVIRWGWKENLR